MVIRRAHCVVALSVALGAHAAADAASPAQTAFVERTRVAALAERCDGLSAGARTALEAGRLQARGALLRAGATPQRLDAIADALADQVSAELACDDPLVANEFARLEDAHAGWRAELQAHFPARHTAWVATRPRFDVPPMWAVKQTRADDDVSVTVGRSTAGVDGGDLALTVLVATNAGVPVSARLIVRDVVLAPDLMDPTFNRLIKGASASLDPLSDWLPPRSMCHAVWAADRLRDLSAFTVPGDPEPSAAFTFDDDVWETVLELDTREAFGIELDVRTDNGSVATTTVLFEVGDVASATMFAGDV